MPNLAAKAPCCAADSSMTSTLSEQDMLRLYLIQSLHASINFIFYFFYSLIRYTARLPANIDRIIFISWNNIYENGTLFKQLPHQLFCTTFSPTDVMNHISITTLTATQIHVLLSYHPKNKYYQMFFGNITCLPMLICIENNTISSS